MFLVALVLVSALAVPLAGGRLGALVELPLRHVWAIYAALGLAVLGVGVPGLPDGLRSLLLVAAYPVGAVFLAANRRVPGMALTALGAALNLLAITANGGVMPASPAALATAGLPVDEPGFQSSDRRRRPPAGLPGRRVRHPGLLAAQQRLQRRGRAHRGRPGLGGAPDLRFAPGPALERRAAPDLGIPWRRPEHRLLISATATATGVTDGTRALCRTAQPGRRRRRRLTADAPLERRGRWSWKPQGPCCRS